MDVRCEKCQTVYEFDDARVKDTGVTVKCTQCGHVFKVTRPGTGAAAPKPRTLTGIPRVATVPGVAAVAPAPAESLESGASSGRHPVPLVEPAVEPPATAITPNPPMVALDVAGAEARTWLLRSAASGEVRRFRDLTSLQQWIVEKRAFRDDEISRTGERWKRIGGIHELEPFFRVVEDAERARAGAAVSTSDAAYAGTVPQHAIGAHERAAMGGPTHHDHVRTIPFLSPVAPAPPGRRPGDLDQAAQGSSIDLGPPGRGAEQPDRIPRRTLLPMPVLIGGGVAALLLLGVIGYIASSKRSALSNLVSEDEAARGREAWKKGREYFLLDTDEDFHRADQQLQRAQGADERNPLPVAALVEVNTTWARWLREDARMAESQPARADELRRSAQTRLDDARRYANEARALSADDPDVNRALADFLVLDGAPAAQVEEALKRAEAKRPDDPELRYVRGALLVREGRYGDARNLLARANDLNQQQTQHDLLRADYMLATLALLNSRNDEARAAAQRILQANPRHQRAATLLAALDNPALLAALRGQPAPPPAAKAVDGGTLAGAAAATDTAVPVPGRAAPPATTPPAAAGSAGVTASSEPRGYEALVEAADRLMERGRSKEAQKLYEKALAAEPQGVEALNGLAYAYLDTERYNAAIDTFKKVLAIVSNNGDALTGLAETYRARGDKQKALGYYQKYLAELPGGAKAAMARQNVEDLKAQLAHGGSTGSTEGHDSPALPSPPPATP